MKNILILAMIAAAFPAAAGAAALESLGSSAGRQAQAAAPSRPVPVEGACKDPGPGATLEELRAWIDCLELPPPPAQAQCREPGPGATIEEIIAWIRCVELPPPPAAGAAKARGGAPGYFDEINLEACPGARQISDNTVICRVDSAEEVHKLPVRRENQVERLPYAATWEAVSLNIWPDDSTEMIFEYSYKLLDAKGRLAGYAQREGFVNYELESRINLLLKYTLAGELAAVTVY